MFAMYRSSENLVTFLILHRVYVVASLVLDYLILETGLEWYNVLGCILVTIGSIIATWTHNEYEHHVQQEAKEHKENKENKQQVKEAKHDKQSKPKSIPPESQPILNKEAKMQAQPHDLLSLSRHAHPESHPVAMHHYHTRTGSL